MYAVARKMKRQLVWLWHFSAIEFEYWLQLKSASNENVISSDFSTPVPALRC